MKTLLLILILTAPLVAAAADSYPLKTCVVSDDKLGEHGKSYVMKYKGQEVRLCCSDCADDFKKDPAKYLSKLKAAKAKP